MGCDQFSVLDNDLVDESELSIKFVFEGWVAGDFLANTDFVSFEDESWGSADGSDKFSVFFLVFEEISDERGCSHGICAAKPAGKDLEI